MSDRGEVSQAQATGEGVGIRALKQNASEVVSRVRQGDSVVVTDRGVPVARIVPIQSTRLDDLVSSGKLLPARTSMSELWARRAGWDRRAPTDVSGDGGSGLTSAEILDELRAERL